MITEEFTLTNYAHPTRLDRVLRERYKGLTQGVIEKALRKGLIKVNGKKADSKLRVIDNDTINIKSVSFESTQESPKFIPKEAKNLSEKLLGEYKIFENENILVINKPAGLAVQGGSKIKLSIDDALSHLNENGGDYKITHRLDKETSGLLLLAKNKTAAFNIFKGFKDRTIKKKYLAILSKIPSQKSGTIESNIGKVDSKNFQKVREDDEDGKIAITDYIVLKVINNFALTEFTPHTGRMHQIRVHAQSLGCPIVGDTKYGDYKQPYKNLFLHAFELHLPKSLLGSEYNFIAPTPEYWEEVI
jgi:23S rRNA pseudouridine955/2504/2580 synthase